MSSESRDITALLAAWRKGDEMALDEVVMIVSHAGMTGKQIAEAVGASVATVKPHWDVARSWLINELES